MNMTLETERLILRPWKETDAESLYEYARDERVGPVAGWPPHTSVENSREVIKYVLSEQETYAVCLKEDNRAIGSIGLMRGKQSNLDLPENEGEIGYWIGVPFWGQGLIPEAVRELIRHAFSDLGIDTLWCAYFDGNEKSKRAQEKCGFTYHHTNRDVYWKLLNENLTEHVTRLTRNEWEAGRVSQKSENSGTAVSGKREEKKLVIYIHGKGGSALEAEHYVPLFPEDTVVGFDYHANTPWEAEKEFGRYFDEIAGDFGRVYLIANSIGAFFSLCSLSEKRIEKAFFISPVVNMEKLICDMMAWANVTENELREKKEIPTAFGETLSCEYLDRVRGHRIVWNIPTEILYGANDDLQSLDTVADFAEKCGANLTVMENGEHWFHTDEQMMFLDEWLKRAK